MGHDLKVSAENTLGEEAFRLSTDETLSPKFAILAVGIMYAVFLISALMALVLAFQLPDGLPVGPALIPLIASTGIILLASIGVISVVTTRKAEGDERWMRVSIGRVVMAVALLLLYSLALPVLGFIIASSGLVVVLMIVAYSKVTSLSTVWKDGVGLLILIVTLYAVFTYALQANLP